MVKSDAKHTIIVADYNPRWPIMYQEEKARILSVIGHIIVAIEHVGSTSVVGLGAKPIIDIMAGLCHLDDAKECIEPLQSISYEYVPEHEVSMPERRYFRKGTSGARTHHLHMVELTSDFWKKQILFRDYLRAHSEVAQQYYELKKELAAKYSSDRDAYTDAKTSFIESVLDKARAERCDRGYEL